MAKVFIDPGHGGRDPGAVGNGMRESDIVLEVSRLLGNALEAAGVSVALSRTDDRALTINERWQAANAWGADILVSVHVNAGGGTGVETLIPTASPNNQRRNLQENRRLAELVSNTLARAFNMRVRRANGVMLETETRHGSIGVLRHSRMLAVLPEIAFIDSPAGNPDIDVLRNRRPEVAAALADSILQFLGKNSSAAPSPAPPPGGNWPISNEVIQRMVDLGVINTPEHWKAVDSVQWLNELLQNAGQEDRLDRRVDNGITNLTVALEVLSMAGIVNSPEYWQEQAQNSGVRFLGQLIINIANRSLDPLHRIVWAEARGEKLKGQIAVANVVINRHNSPQFPNGIYNVIHQANQFSPVRNGSYAAATPLPMNKLAVNKALSGVDHSRGALFFDSAPNSWARQIRTHLFDLGNHSFFA